MKFTTFISSLLAFGTMSNAAINLSYAPEIDRLNQIVLGENVRIAWESDKTYVCVSLFFFFPLPPHAI